MGWVLNTGPVTSAPASGVRARKEGNTWGRNDWRAPVVARPADLSDTGGFLGVAKGAGSARPTEATGSATPDEPLWLAFRLSQRAAEAPPLTYCFDVACALPHAEVALNLPELSTPPRPDRLPLVDKPTGCAVAPRTRNTCRYQTGATGEVRSFRV
jgi:hypothetical protein